MDLLKEQPFYKIRIPFEDSALSRFLVSELKECVQQLLAANNQPPETPRPTQSEETPRGLQVEIFDESPFAQKLIFLLECILIHGLKDRLIGHYSFWDVAEKLPECLPGSAANLTTVKDISKTPIGRQRVFIRVCLNEGAMVETLTALVWNEQLLKNFYKETAILRNSEFSNSMLELLDTLKSVTFSLVVKDSGFEKPTFWNAIDFPTSLKVPPPNSNPVSIEKGTMVQESMENSVQDSLSPPVDNDPEPMMIVGSSTVMDEASEGSRDLKDDKNKGKKKKKNRRVIAAFQNLEDQELIKKETVPPLPETTEDSDLSPKQSILQLVNSAIEQEAIAQNEAISKEKEREKEREKEKQIELEREKEREKELEKEREKDRERE